MTRRDRLLAAVILLGLAAAAAILGLRWRIEARSRTVEVILDGAAWRELAIREGRRPGDLLADLHARGATSVALYEHTLETLAEDGLAAYRSGGEALAEVRAGALGEPFRSLVAGGAVRPEAVYVLAHPVMRDWVEDGFRRLLGASRVRRLGEVLEVLGFVDDVEDIGLGFDPLLAVAVRESAFHLVLRPRNYRGLTEESIARKIDAFRTVGRGQTVVFEGADVLGFERLIEEAARGLSALDYRVGRIEAFTARRKQRGEDALTAKMRPQVLRLFSLTPEELAVLPPAAIVDKFLRAPQERSIRLLYVRPMANTPGGVDAIEANLTLVANITQRLVANGFRPGRAEPIPDLLPPAPLLALVVAGALALGAAAIADLAAASGIRVGTAGLLGLVAGGGLASALAALRPGGDLWLLWLKLLALGVAVAGATLAVSRSLTAAAREGIPAGRRVLGHSVLTLWQAAAISTAAGVLVAALLTSWPFMLAVHTFVGVKVAHILPPVLAAFLLVFSVRPEADLRSTAREIWHWLERPLRLQVAVLAVVAAVAAVMLLGRSGNVGLPLFGVEARARDLLEDLLVARPRTKEFLIGHPALMLAGAAAALRLRAWVVPLAVIGAVGQAGLINSFSHIHTPLVIVLLRTLYALIIGTVLGVVPVAVLTWLIRRWRPEPAPGAAEEATVRAAPPPAVD
ncbi:MAG: hypothetical protein HY334_08990 [Armatimonadetes bacterium]|nr:hypothetical protein [Armatimonadota bacterium]